MNYRLLNRGKFWGKQFRIYGTVENPLFLAKEVAEWIDYAGRTGQLLTNIENDEKGEYIVCTLGGKQSAWFLTEDGLAEWIDYSKRSDGSYQVGQMLRAIDNEEKISTVNNLNGKEMWFLAKEVAEWIEYDVEQVGKLLRVVDGDEKKKEYRNTVTGLKEMWFLTEDGLYEVLMQSRKPIANQQGLLMV
ncbi:BRO family protein [Clostridium tyrobutyricum]|uniref:BRO family protein n=1 Tax=Clostridium tyrobutyricum TaxID=1519 RepID=UPI0030D0A2B6